MRAVWFTRYGGPEVLELAEVPEPHPGPGHIRIQVRAAAVNPYDWKVRTGAESGGRPLERPVITGQEASGIVDEVGEGVAGVAPGDAVFGPTVRGAVAGFALLRHWGPQPRNSDFVASAGLAVVSETAERTLRHLGAPPGATIVVHGGAGGVGQAAIQLARLRGLAVVATAREANHALLASLGALPTTYGPGLAARVAALAPAGVAGAIDTAGTDLDELIALAGAPHVVSIANYAAAARGAVLTFGGRDSAWDVLPRIAALVEEGRFRVPVERVLPFREAAEAHRLSESRRVRHSDALLCGLGPLP